MSTKRSQRQDSIATDRGSDSRPNYILLGVDAEGADHIYRTIDDTIIVVTSDGRREHVQELDGRSAHKWMAFVADIRGWTTQYFVESFGDSLDAAREEV